MVTFICELDWAMGYPDIWLNTIVDVSEVLDEINIWISELRVKQIALHDVNGNHLVN